MADYNRDQRAATVRERSDVWYTRVVSKARTRHNRVVHRVVFSLFSGFAIAIGLVVYGAFFTGIGRNARSIGPRYLKESEDVSVWRFDRTLVSEARLDFAQVFETPEARSEIVTGLYDGPIHLMFVRGERSIALHDLPRWLRQDACRFHGPNRVFMAATGQCDFYGESNTFAFGFPFRCVTFRRVWGESTGNLIDGLEFDPPDFVYRMADPPELFVIPYGVMLWPSIGNTLAWSFPVFLILTRLASARQWNRTRRGRCGLCAYDLRGDLESGCPECGWKREPTAQPDAPSSPPPADPC